MDIYFYYSEQKDKFSYLFCFFTLLFCNYAKSNAHIPKLLLLNKS